jgi:D-sedoheptulose 7-phosphate isomerase
MGPNLVIQTGGGGFVSVLPTLPTKRIAEQYLATFSSLVRGIDLDVIERIVDRIRSVRDDGRTVYIAGNGGSAATAAHWVNDLGKATKRSGQRPIRVIGLADNAPWLTALGNDEGFDRVFAGQLENFAQADDLLIVISASGRSRNLVKAVELARERGLVTVGLLGFDGGLLKDMVTDVLLIESEVGAYGPVETAHALVADIITTCLIQDVGFR